MRWIHFPLHPETPAEGLSLEALFAGRDLNIPAMRARVREAVEADGLGLAERTHTYNSRRAQELSLWAESLGQGPALDWELYLAYFARAENLAQTDVLLGAAQRAGLDVELAQKTLKERPFRASLEKHYKRCEENGVRSVPSVLFDSTYHERLEAAGAPTALISGALAENQLESLLRAAGAEPR